MPDFRQPAGVAPQHLLHPSFGSTRILMVLTLLVLLLPSCAQRQERAPKKVTYTTAEFVKALESMVPPHPECTPGESAASLAERYRAMDWVVTEVSDSRLVATSSGPTLTQKLTGGHCPEKSSVAIDFPEK